MSQEKLVSVLTMYREHLKKQNPGLAAVRHLGRIEEEDPAQASERVLEHLLFTIEGALALAQDPTRREKLMRHLGFIQGVLWCTDTFTVDDLMRHNMPDPAEAS